MSNLSKVQIIISALKNLFNFITEKEKNLVSKYKDFLALFSKYGDKIILFMKKKLSILLRELEIKN